jgi:glycosyltransferase involved in cell wall biosynthesis
MRPLTIGIDCRPALSRMTGVGRYVSSLIGALAGLDRENRYLLFSSSFKERSPVNALPGNFRRVDRHIPVRLLNVLWHRLGRPSLDLLAGETVDIAHSPHPLILPSRRGRSVVTIHDLYFLRHPEATGAEVRRDYVPLVEAHARRADAIVTVSQATADDVAQALEVPPERIARIPLGVEKEAFRPRPDEESILRHYDLPRNYALSVATLEPRKNLPRLVEAAALLVGRGWDGVLVLAGGEGGDEGRVEAAVSRRGLAARVKRLGYVPPEHLPALYRKARLLVTASLWEGFGLPVLEAMACDTPVVASDLKAHREVAADGVLYVDPNDPPSIAEGVERVWSDAPLGRKLVEAGRHRVALFTWEQTARQTLALYQRLGERK